MFLACRTMHEPYDNFWLLNSGCSRHMSSSKNLVVNLNQSIRTEVNLGTKNTMDVDGKGVIKILTKQGEPKTISKVYYVPSLKPNLISVGQLTEKGYKVIFLGQECVVYVKPPSKQVIEKV